MKKSGKTIKNQEKNRNKSVTNHEKSGKIRKNQEKIMNTSGKS